MTSSRPDHYVRTGLCLDLAPGRNRARRRRPRSQTAGDRLLFNYGHSYLARDDAIAIYDARAAAAARAILPLLNGLSMPSCLRDARARRLGPARHHQPQARRARARYRHRGSSTS